MIINSGIKRIVYRNGYPDEFSLQLLKESGVEIEQYKE
jgi:dCMP deaminase